MAFKNQSCDNCLWWGGFDSKDTQGRCLRFPPQVTNVRVREWPVTHDEDWCGEWVKRDDSTARATVREG